MDRRTTKILQRLARQKHIDFDELSEQEKKALRQLSRLAHAPEYSMRNPPTKSRGRPRGAAPWWALSDIAQLGRIAEAFERHQRNNRARLRIPASKLDEFLDRDQAPTTKEAYEIVYGDERDAPGGHTRGEFIMILDQEAQWNLERQRQWERIEEERKRGAMMGDEELMLLYIKQAHRKLDEWYKITSRDPSISAKNKKKIASIVYRIRGGRAKVKTYHAHVPGDPDLDLDLNAEGKPEAGVDAATGEIRRDKGERAVFRPNWRTYQYVVTRTQNDADFWRNLAHEELHAWQWNYARKEQWDSPDREDPTEVLDGILKDLGSGSSKSGAVPVSNADLERRLNRVLGLGVERKMTLQQTREKYDRGEMSPLDALKAELISIEEAIKLGVTRQELENEGYAIPPEAARLFKARSASTTQPSH